jgi:methyl-accepting chemotaxis protein
MYKRKTYIINKEFQYSFIATFQFIIIISLIIFSAGFFLYYWIMHMTGERVYQEFLSLSQQITINIQPLTDEDIKDPYGMLSQLNKKNEDKALIRFIRDNMPPDGLLKIDDSSENNSASDVKKLVTLNLNYFLQTLIKQRKIFYKEERFKDVNLPKEIQDQVKMELDPQSELMYNLNLMLLASAFSPRIEITGENRKVVPLNYQKEIIGLKRHDIVLPPLLINNLLIMLMTIIVGIFYSHRIAGPMYRIETDIKRVLDGEKGVLVRLRKKDKMKTLAELVNKLIEQVEKSRK